jgi:hypothetical protein
MALREINERTSDKMRVTLYWQDDDDTMTVEVEDWKDSGNDLTLTGIPKADWKQAFEHPFGYSSKREKVTA